MAMSMIVNMKVVEQNWVAYKETQSNSSVMGLKMNINYVGRDACPTMLFRRAVSTFPFRCQLSHKVMALPRVDLRITFLI